MSAFFVTGLPCSRTAWLANWLTTDRSFCHHDLLGRVAGLGEYQKAMSQRPRTGDADSGLLACYSQVREIWPSAPWVLVRRDFDDAWQSLCRFVESGPWSDKLPLTWEVEQRMRADWERAVADLSRLPQVMAVSYEALDDSDTLERVWKHLLPGHWFDRKRTEALQTLRVQVFQAKAPARPPMTLIGELVKG